jgi:hypothetical protein
MNTQIPFEELGKLFPSTLPFHRCDLDPEIFWKRTVGKNVDFYIGKKGRETNCVYTTYKLFIGMYNPENDMVVFVD